MNGKSWEVVKSEFANMTNPSESAKEIHDIMIRGHLQVNGPVVYLNPLVTERMEENLFKSEKRDYPVDFATPFETLYVGKITIPDGYEVEELPKQKLIALPANGGKYAYNLTQSGNVISVISQLTISKGLFVQTEYPALREFYDQVIAKQSEFIVLKQK